MNANKTQIIIASNSVLKPYKTSLEFWEIYGVLYPWMFNMYASMNLTQMVKPELKLNNPCLIVMLQVSDFFVGNSIPSNSKPKVHPISERSKSFKNIIYYKILTFNVFCNQKFEKVNVNHNSEVHCNHSKCFLKP